VAGVGLTATIATDRAKRGEHRAHLAATDHLATRLAGIVLHKGARDRAAEERLVGRLALRLMAEAKGVLRELSLHLEADERVETDFLPGEELRAFAEGVDRCWRSMRPAAAWTLCPGPGAAPARRARAPW
jgi:hypothetical protein